jgi:hypothetical protein
MEKHLMGDWKPLSPACMKCEQVTGKDTCFPGLCVFFHERNTPGSKAHQVAMIDRIRRGMREPVHASASITRTTGDGDGNNG